jgi:hypothetical protein
MKNKDIHLVAYYFIRPRDPARTKESGYIKDPENFIYDESINITRGLKPRDERTAKVILNLSSKIVVRNNFNDNKDFVSLLAYYQEGYPKYLNPLIGQLYMEQTEYATDVQGKEKEA